VGHCHGVPTVGRHRLQIRSPGCQRVGRQNRSLATVPVLQVPIGRLLVLVPLRGHLWVVRGQLRGLRHRRCLLPSVPSFGAVAFAWVQAALVVAVAPVAPLSPGCWRSQRN